MSEAKISEDRSVSDREVDVHQLATLVRDKRGSRGLRDTAREITEHFGEVSASTLSRVEQGKLPDLDVYMRLCRWLGVSPSQFATNRQSQTIMSDDSVNLSTPQQIEVHLRADRELTAEQADALVTMMRLAYEALADGRLGKKKGG